MQHVGEEVGVIDEKISQNVESLECVENVLIMEMFTRGRADASVVAKIIEVKDIKKTITFIDT